MWWICNPVFKPHLHSHYKSTLHIITVCSTTKVPCYMIFYIYCILEVSYDWRNSCNISYLSIYISCDYLSIYTRHVKGRVLAAMADGTVVILASYLSIYLVIIYLSILGMWRGVYWQLWLMEQLQYFIEIKKDNGT